jgi:Mrp family chromosome partitioning ATPase
VWIDRRVFSGPLRAAAGRLWLALPGHGSSETSIVALVVGPTRGERSRSVACALAAAAAASAERPVLLVDAGRVPRRLRKAVPGAAGSFEEALVETKVPGLSRLWLRQVEGARRSDGTLHPAVLRRVLREARERFGVVVVDVPAMHRDPVSLGLADVVDAAVLVISASGTSRGVVARAADALERGGLRLCGVFLDRAPRSGVGRVG